MQTKNGDLGELLVFNGLARIHGTRGAPPGGASSAEEITKLQELEHKAKEAKRGGWNAGGIASQKFEALPAVATTPTPRQMASVPEKPAGSIGSKGHPDAADGAKLDVNTATQEQLQKIPGVGSSLSARIMAARPFKSADDLKNLKGIGSGKRYEELRPFFK